MACYLINKNFISLLPSEDFILVFESVDFSYSSSVIKLKYRK